MNKIIKERPSSLTHRQETFQRNIYTCLQSRLHENREARGRHGGNNIFEMLDEENFIPCKVAKPVLLRIGAPNVEFNSGCSVIEVTLPASNGCKIGFIKFKNNCVASLSIRLKLKEEGGDVLWKTSLRDYVLMPSPHHEQASQDYFIIDARKQFSIQPENVIGARLILRQPSPHWLTFSLEDVKFFMPSQDLQGRDVKHKNELVKQNEAGANFEDPIDDLDVNISELSAKVSKIVSMATDKRIINSLKKTASSRFDVDGSYDLNLLSYT